MLLVRKLAESQLKKPIMGSMGGTGGSRVEISDRNDAANGAKLGSTN
jgi:hypothetical protein